MKDIIAQVIAGNSLNLIKHATPQVIRKTPEKRAYGEVYFPVTPPPIFAAIRYLFYCLKNQVLLPSWIWNYWMKLALLSPTYKRQYKVIQTYVDG